jgi:hypothetical protein
MWAIISCTRPLRPPSAARRRPLEGMRPGGERTRYPARQATRRAPGAPATGPSDSQQRSVTHVKLERATPTRFKAQIAPRLIRATSLLAATW